MSIASELRSVAARGLDAAMEVTVAPSFSAVGYAVRERLEGWEPPAADMSAATVLVTGASSGLGKSATLSLAGMGAGLIVLGRDVARLEEVAADALDAGARQVLAIPTDMSDLGQVAEAAGQVMATTDRLDVLIHNAGALVHEFRLSPDGFEQTYAAQVLGPHVLTTLMLPLLMATPGSRVITVSSGGMYAERLDVDAVEMGPDDYDGVRAYARAKRAQVALTEQWARRFADSGVVFHSMHPGWADTPGVAESLPGFRRVMGRALRSPGQGADTIVWLAVDPHPLASTGEFWLDRRPRKVVKLPWAGQSPEAGAELWHRVCRETGVNPEVLG